MKNLWYSEELNRKIKGKKDNLILNNILKEIIYKK